MPVIGERDYFIRECGRFHHLLTERSFWEKPENKDAAIKALGHLYLNTKDLRDGDETYFETAIQHCALREAAMLLHSESPCPEGTP